ncbi:UPF0481 protein At3g47200-like [Diospyros lotus]|uniref:UPF0481 protein At3g47200-like n=1 Tax=Diospyros lotus TaxID=55363 RepID=UPI002253E29C|nr:UPF0481 protein At3g47200-like [Diospyros lotus]
MGSCVVEMQAMLNNPEQLGRKRTSIYKVPPFISNINETPYLPRVVSFGPYHHEETKLASMEAHKKRTLIHYIHQSGLTMQDVFALVAEMAQELKDSYDSLDAKRQDNTERFVQLMILDGCFMLEVLRVAYKFENYYSDDDPIFSQHGDLYVIPFIKADMLMLENQLPILLLLRLKHILKNVEPDINELNKEILDFLNYNIRDGEYSKMGECLHVLDLHRKGLLHTHNEHGNAAPNSTNQGKGNYPKMGKCLHKLDLNCKRLLHTHNKPRDRHNVVRPAIELHEAGVRFMKSKSKSLQDITFDGGLLKLPYFIVDDFTKSMFLNLIAFERCHIPAGSDITSFVAFMDRIIDDSQDIKLLSSKGIIDNYIGNDKEAADLFNTMSKDLVMEMNENLKNVYTNLIAYCDMPWHKWNKKGHVYGLGSQGRQSFPVVFDSNSSGSYGLSSELEQMRLKVTQINKELYSAQTKVVEVENQLQSTESWMNAELHSAWIEVTEMRNENVQLRQWQQQMMA